MIFDDLYLDHHMIRYRCIVSQYKITYIAHQKTSKVLHNNKLQPIKFSEESTHIASMDIKKFLVLVIPFSCNQMFMFIA